MLSYWIMDGEPGYRPPIAETETTNPSQKLEQNFVEGFAAFLSRHPDYPCTPQDYIQRHKLGIVQAFGAVAPKDGRTYLPDKEADDPQNYVFRFGAGVLREDDLAKLGVPFAQKGREALIWKALQRNTAGKPNSADDPNMADFTWGIENDVVLRVRISGNHYRVQEPVRVVSCVAEVPLVQSTPQENKQAAPGMTGEDLINSAVQKATVAKL